MNSEIDTVEFCQRLCEIAGHPTDPENPDSLVGILQKFRPEGREVKSIFEGIPEGEAIASRLMQVFEVAGNPARSDGMRDAFFLVRHPKKAKVSEIVESAENFFLGLRNLALENDLKDVACQLEPIPTIRVVEGLAPKHPKADNEKSKLLKAIQTQGPRVTDANARRCQFASLLRAAFYFLSCDAFLRDYLLWPFYELDAETKDPYAPYFHLWKHGVKYRIFGEQQVDLYLPRVFLD